MSVGREIMYTRKGNLVLFFATKWKPFYIECRESVLE